MKVIICNDPARIVQNFLHQLMEFQGTYVRIPIVDSQIQWVVNGKSGEEGAKEIFDQTCELLTMMGIEYRTNPTSFSIMVELPPLPF